MFVVAIVLGLVMSLLCPYANSYESTQTLPKSISRFRTITIFTENIDKRFNADGNTTGLAAEMNRTLTAGRVIQEGIKAKPNEPKVQELQTLYNALNNADPGQNLGDKLFQVQIDAKSSVRSKAFAVGYEFGITDEWSVGFAVPMYSFNVKADVTATVVSQAPQLQADPFIKNANLAPKLAEFDANKALIESYVIDGIFTSKGYEKPRDFQMESVGEVEIGIKKAFVRSAHHGLSHQVGFRLPTASHAKNYRNPFDPGAGDGQFDISNTTAYDYFPDDGIRFGTALKTTFQLPDQEYRPLLRVGESGLPNLNDPYIWENVNRNLGDSLETEISANYSFWKKRFTISTLYLYLLKDQDTYTGSKGLDYGSLQKNTAKSQHQYELAINFATIEDVLRGRSKFPIDTRLAYTNTFSGRNSIKTALYRFDLNFFFR